MARIIGEVRPKFVFVENSPLLVSRGLTRVLGDLAEMGYDARWGVLGACDAGAPHKRERIWIVANSAEITQNLLKLSQEVKQRPSLLLWGTPKPHDPQREAEPGGTPSSRALPTGNPARR
jgi:DNA (cytosine-5)-methyltransferase 1